VTGKDEGRESALEDFAQPQPKATLRECEEEAALTGRRASDEEEVGRWRSPPTFRSPN